MSSDIDISGYLFTQEEWLDLDDDLRTELLDSRVPIMEPSSIEPSSLEA